MRFGSSAFNHYDVQWDAADKIARKHGYWVCDAWDQLHCLVVRVLARCKLAIDTASVGKVVFGSVSGRYARLNADISGYCAFVSSVNVAGRSQRSKVDPGSETVA